MTSPGLRLLFLGMTTPFATPPLAHLLAAGMDVCAVVVPGEGPEPLSPLVPERPSPPALSLPLRQRFAERHCLSLAWEHGIPTYSLSRPGDPAARAALADLAPDLIVVACFSLRLPAPLLNLPPYGCLNLHPALLPEYRGPAPLFWAMRDGRSATGVTVHFMDVGLDTGDIALQAPVPLAPGLSGPAAERRCAERGGQLLVEAVRRLAAGTLPRRPQPPGGSYQPWPTAADFRLGPGWPAARAFQFMRGTAEWGQPYTIHLGESTLALAMAASYDADGQLAGLWEQDGRFANIQFSPGILRARLAG